MKNHRSPKARKYVSRPLRPNPSVFYVQRPNQPVTMFTVYSTGDQIHIQPYQKGDEQRDDTYIKKSDSLGRISIPAALKTGRLKSSPLEVTMINDTTYILAPVKYKTCRLCGCSSQDAPLIKVIDHLICQPCLQKLCASNGKGKEGGCPPSF